MKMPFGKFVGTEVHELETWYLSWLLDNIKFKSKALEDEVADEYDDRSTEEDW